MDGAWSDLNEAKRHLPASDGSGGVQTRFRLQLLIRQGKLETAVQLLEMTDWPAFRMEYPLLWACYSLCKADVHLAKNDIAPAQPIVEQVMEWAEQTGHQETWIRAMHAASKIRMRLGTNSEVGVLLDDVERVARGKGFTIWLIECLLLQGHRHLLVEELSRAEEFAREAISFSDDAVTGYKWGLASASHLAADIHLRQRRMEEARAFARDACAVRASLKDARLWNSQALLTRINEW